MSPNPKVPENLVSFGDEILNGKPQLLCTAKKGNLKLLPSSLLFFFSENKLD